MHAKINVYYYYDANDYVHKINLVIFEYTQFNIYMYKYSTCTCTCTSVCVCLLSITNIIYSTCSTGSQFLQYHIMLIKY